ncbi:Chromatin modification-related protein YNG2 [Talaromyces islandicus]|uniref:Chromatin modification-related protein n=1 Tax=Talaromyces islandicus TaxID=28573 RepID=A0A0U1LTF5_TALIS|nr:Chromatin modification-related protein YNG2 [Talaromyces islandicus]
MADDTDDSGGVILEGPFDPDAQATVTDFIDYTEYLPSDLIRSLTLIRGLDETYVEATQAVHQLTKVYGQLPDLPPDSRPNPQDLREQISVQLNRAINAREASYAEANRLHEVVERHHGRLGNIKKKLSLLPKPPSREPTPAPLSPAAVKRSRSGRKAEDVTTRITLRVDGQGSNRSGLPKSRSRRSALAGLDPDSPIASTEHSDNEMPKARSRRPLKDGEGPSPKKDKKRARPPRPPGMGTNVHSSVAGISTSNALALLKPPPEDAKIGSEDLPWLRLTDWEMTKLRKKMKKNAVWQPSEIMINRELARNGRGWECYRAAKAQAEATGEEFIDCDDIENTYVPGKLTRKTEATADTSAAEEIKTSNRGMKLNEAKKLKRETLIRENAAALAAAEAEMAAKRLRDIGSTFKSLFNTSPEANHAVPGLLNSTMPNGSPSTPSANQKAKSPRKRKAEKTPSTEPAPAPSSVQTNNRAASPKPSSKRRKISQAPSVEGVAVSEGSIPPVSDTAAAGTKQKGIKVPSSSPPPTRARSAASQASISNTAFSTISGVVGRKPMATPTPPVTRPPSRRRSAEPIAAAFGRAASREHLRRKSTTPAAKTPAPEAGLGSNTGPPVRRKRRPAPGPISANHDGGATVTHGTRKFKPKKRVTGRDSAKGDDFRIDEDGVLEKVDPNEPRYCLCKDVSFGTMINCENQDCEGEWFHLECVGLKEPPSRRATWYCPECRVKLNKAPDGIERSAVRR